MLIGAEVALVNSEGRVKSEDSSTQWRLSQKTLARSQNFSLRDVSTQKDTYRHDNRSVHCEVYNKVLAFPQNNGQYRTAGRIRDFELPFKL